jgi:hypothetical protein
VFIGITKFIIKSKKIMIHFIYKINKIFARMFKRIKTLGDMETMQKCSVQRDEIIIPSTKNNDTIIFPGVAIIIATP